MKPVNVWSTTGALCSLHVFFHNPLTLQMSHLFKVTNVLLTWDSRATRAAYTHSLSQFSVCATILIFYSRHGGFCTNIKNAQHQSASEYFMRSVAGKRSEVLAPERSFISRAPSRRRCNDHYSWNDLVKCMKHARESSAGWCCNVSTISSVKYECGAELQCPCSPNVTVHHTDSSLLYSGLLHSGQSVTKAWGTRFRLKNNRPKKKKKSSELCQPLLPPLRLRKYSSAKVHVNGQRRCWRVIPHITFPCNWWRKRRSQL